MTNCCGTTAKGIFWSSGCRLSLLVVGFAVLYWGLLRVQPIYAFGNFGFWVILLSPLWIPMIFASNPLERAWLRMLLVIPAILWYLFLEVLSHHVSVIVIIAGSIVALTALAFAFRGRWHLVAVPLWISILLGTASILLRSQ